MPHYMVELVLVRRPLLVVGGGRVAGRKIAGLLACQARVTVVAPELVDPQVAAWVEEGVVDHRPERFSEAALEWTPRPVLVFAATGEAALNREVARLCAGRGILCNSADDPACSGFLVPAVARRGPVSVGVGTGGLSPALSRLLKERLDGWLEPGWGRLAVCFGAWRGRVTATIPEGEQRQRFWRQAALEAVEQGCLEGEEQDLWLEERLEHHRER
ncbi:MAG: bifunctional precorrin-2 dehydrogenase/sirohydrochlorin ferrochelatase [Magnetococcales bacterium]|nr:bifunctional precorrin-2 dehydrogenase/sirohydrochlorin ferrochelatase [Magnetococcales bacterium]